MAGFPHKKIIEQLKSDHPKILDDALHKVIKNFKKTILKLLQSRSAKLEDAQEVFNESLLILVKNARKGLLDRSNANIKSYLTAICMNRMWAKFNKKIDFEDLDLPDIQNIALETNHLDFLVAEEQNELIEKMIQHLGTKCQDILRRFYWYNQKMADIAEQMGYANEQVARNKKAKCLNQIRKIFGGKKSLFLD